MCGIAGILGNRDAGGVSFEELRRMVSVLRHRGPEGYGLYRDDRMGLAHARLSIIDLEGGAQPIHNEDQSVWIVLNGEIFNYLELRRPLEERGHRFYTRSDTEVIVHAFEEYGERAWAMFNGQFALALWDSRTRRLWLVRDRVGILPLYYACAEGRVIFGSEAKALFAGGRVTPRIDPSGLAEVFSRWATAGPGTVFQGVRIVAPGAAVSFNEDLRECESVYWRLDMTEDPALRDRSPDEMADALGERLTRAVRLRLRADVPVGAYLSGGLDSAVIGHLVRRVDSSPLQTFAVRFEDPAFDETEPQRRMAALLGTEHHETLCGATEIRNALPEVIWHCEAPLLRTAPVPLYLLSQLVSRRGMKVVLTGEGADEFLAGYDLFKEDKVRRFWARQPESRARPALLARLYRDVAPDRDAGNPLWQQFFRRGLTEVDDPFYSHRIRWRNTAWALRLLAPDVRLSLAPERLDAEVAGRLPDGWRHWPPLARAQAIEIHSFLTAYLLAYQGDRVAMGHGVEVRPPFLDPDVIDFCARLPGRFKLRGLCDKLILRRMASRFLPPEVWQRPKHPYRAPMTTVFFSGTDDDYVGELTSRSALGRFGLVDVPAAAQLVEKARARVGRMAGEREEMALVGLLTLQLLGHFFLEGLAGRVKDARRALDACTPNVHVDRTAARLAEE